VDRDFNVSQELLKSAKGVDIFNELNNMIYIHKVLQKCTAIVTDEANSVTRENIGGAGFLKQNGHH